MTLDASERRFRRARRALLLVEVLHYVVGIVPLVVAVPFLAGGVFDLLGRIGRSGLVAWRDVDRCLTGLALVAYAFFTLRSASHMGRLKSRSFSAWWAAAHAATVVALPVALLTWLVLTRESVKELYEARVVPFEPLMLPPPLPVPVLPLESTASCSAPATL